MSVEGGDQNTGQTVVLTDEEEGLRETAAIKLQAKFRQQIATRNVALIRQIYANARRHIHELKHEPLSTTEGRKSVMKEVLNSAKRCRNIYKACMIEKSEKKKGAGSEAQLGEVEEISNALDGELAWMQMTAQADTDVVEREKALEEEKKKAFEAELEANWKKQSALEEERKKALEDQKQNASEEERQKISNASDAWNAAARLSSSVLDISFALVQVKRGSSFGTELKTPLSPLSEIRKRRSIEEAARLSVSSSSLSPTSKRKSTEGVEEQDHETVMNELHAASAKHTSLQNVVRQVQTLKSALTLLHSNDADATEEMAGLGEMLVNLKLHAVEVAQLVMKLKAKLSYAKKVLELQPGSSAEKARQKTGKRLSNSYKDSRATGPTNSAQRQNGSLRGQSADSMQKKRSMGALTGATSKQNPKLPQLGYCRERSERKKEASNVDWKHHEATEVGSPWAWKPEGISGERLQSIFANLKPHEVQSMLKALGLDALYQRILHAMCTDIDIHTYADFVWRKAHGVNGKALFSAVFKQSLRLPEAEILLARDKITNWAIKQNADSDHSRDLDLSNANVEVSPVKLTVGERTNRKRKVSAYETSSLRHWRPQGSNEKIASATHDGCFPCKPSPYDQPRLIMSTPRVSIYERYVFK